jgi:transcription antitermination factor NusG
MVIVRSRSERLRKVRRQWSDRIRIQALPLFACNVFCRFEPNQAPVVLKISGVFSILEADGKPLPVPEMEIARLQRILSLDPFVDDCERVELGDVVEIVGSEPIRGVVTERGSTCRIVISLDSLGRAVSIRMPLSALVKINDMDPSTPLNDWGYRGKSDVT